MPIFPCIVGMHNIHFFSDVLIFLNTSLLTVIFVTAEIPFNSHIKVAMKMYVLTNLGTNVTVKFWIP